MPDSAYPFIEDFLRARKGTVYALSDAQVRLRDAYAILALIRFFAANGVDIDLRPVLAEYTRAFDARFLSGLFKDESDAERAASILEGTGPVGDRIQELFREADQLRRERLRQSGNQAAAAEATQLPVRGPVLLLGRPSLFPEGLRREILREFENAGRGGSLEGRFAFACPDPHTDPDGYRTIVDGYSGVRLTRPPYGLPVSGALEAPANLLHSEHAILRLVRGRFPFRSFLLAYGSGSMGTRAAAQTLVDRELNAELVSLGVVDFLDKHKFAEILLRADQFVDPRQPWQDEFAPSRITPLLRPVSPPPASVTAFLDWLKGGATSPTDEFAGLYRLSRAEDAIASLTVDCVSPSFLADPERGRRAVWRLVGGEAIQRVVAELREAARQGERSPILLVGETGVGKEIAARIIYEGVAVRLLKALHDNKKLPKPVLLGPRFVPKNCAALTESLAASELFGIVKEAATDVAPNPGPLLLAGEGVVLLDEIESMRLTDQATLLRTLDPPYVVTPVGSSLRVPVSALVVAAINVEPHQLVAANGMRSDLYGRLQTRVIRIPPLRDRREDIPALLAHLAGGDVLIQRTALTALLLYDHPLNVRGLLAVVSRARRRRPGAEPTPRLGTRPLTIRTEDLDGPMAVIASELFEQGLGREDTAFFRFRSEFVAEGTGRIFEQAAELLGSLRVVETDGGWRFTWRARNDAFDTKFALSAYGEDAEQDFVERYCELIGAAVELSHRGERDPSEALRALGSLFDLPWAEKGMRSEAIRLLWERKPGRMVKRHFAMAVKEAPSGLTQLLKTKRRGRGRNRTPTPRSPVSDP